MPERTDEEIAAQVQAGDTESFRVLVERYEQKMSRYARRFLFNADETKDLLQETFIKAFVNIKSFDAGRKFSPWLYRIAHNEFINAIKKKSKERNTMSLFDFDVLLPHPVAQETADEGMVKQELRVVLEHSLEKINPKYREPLTLYYFDDMDYREIAEILHVPVSTVGVRLQRGKTLLRKLMDDTKHKIYAS